MAEPAGRISRDDIEAKLRSIKGEIEERADTAKRSLLPAAAAGGLLLVVVVYLLGRRAGRKRSTVVEIRRI